MADKKNRRELFYMFHVKKYDIMFIQETHSDQKTQHIWKNEFGSKIWFDHGSSKERGVAIAINSKLPIKVLEAYRLQNYPGHFIALKVVILGETFLLANIYGPNIDTPTFFTEVFKRLEQTGIDRKIVGGDFNLILDNGIDRKGAGIHRNSRAQEVVNDCKESLNLVDIWRFWRTEDSGYMWERRKPTLVFARLNFFLVAESLVQVIKKAIDNTCIKVGR